MDQQKRIGIQGQLLTLFIISLAIIVYSFPRLSSLFVYDRQAILNGELWRLLTAPFVHFSASHIFWDILVFGIAGFAISMSGFSCFWIVCGFAAFIPGLIFVPAFPNLEYYGGLSGLATAAAAYFCLCNIFKSGRKKGIWLAILIVMFIKIIVEAVMDESIFAHAQEVPFRILPAAHVIGYLGALATVTWSNPGITLQKS